ncbi:HAD-IA family hydrolase [Pseudodesulfovibrio senegalensis]|uniref:HAD-IA family hydrolase n=1 Tax=Pseudodesulfovibrio senegalensis TaxID=1721087 RepID=A0A6N6N3D8_9BACT|nr:HAD-IA family hydrolase [Pseudodesulfovibrio senegalensis]KAB1442222.1 HAD-IA family hydrolase [Pseudodesulfovibrio senegalensis]
MELKGVVFDLDGVITRTARVHSLSWEKAFNQLLKHVAERDNSRFEPFDRIHDYQNYVDGKPRFEGVLSFLKARNIQLPPGTPDDEPGLETICAVGNLKNELFQDILRREGPEVFQSSVELIEDLKKNGIHVGVATSSRNCQLVLRLAGMEDVFEVQVDGVVSAELGLKGKPDPDIFVTAATEMGLTPGQCVVVEDAIAGVQAGNAGNFGMTLGVARNVGGELLKRFGADMVVSDLSEITVEDMREWFETGMATDAWHLTYNGFDPGDEKLRETLTTVGNGYLGTRGAYECECSSFYFYPGTYIAGIFNKVPSKVQGKEIFNNDFVNCPNWLPVSFRVGNGQFMSPLSMEILSYCHRLDMRNGVMERHMVVKDNVGRLTRVSSKRLASMADPHLCALKFDLTPLNYSEKITIRSAIDGNVTNGGVARYSKLTCKHLSRVSGGKLGNGVYLHVETSHSRYQVVMAARMQLLEDNKPLDVKKRTFQEKSKVVEEVCFRATENANYSLEKFVNVRTSLDHDATEDLHDQAMEALNEVKTFQGVLGPHTRIWKSLWDKTDIRISGDRFVQRVLRLHTYHLLVTASPHNVDIDAGMPARGLSGEAYRGHIFWDEVYIQPFFDIHFPDISKALLLYRYNRLDAARSYARENGYMGAMFPWQTADDGSEETQEIHYNPESKKWDPDLSRRQRHVSIAVFVNAWRYVNMTGDSTFLKDYGAELMLDIARFWGDIAEFDEESGKYHIAGVMGPDEFHEKLPGSDEPGITDNAYTNIMVVWLLEKSLEMIKELPAKALAGVRNRIGLTDSEIEKWQDMITKLNVIMTDDGIISQFDGYMDLKELDWDSYRKRFYSIHRMDRILKAEGDSPDNYKVAKQADVLMTWYILEPDEVARILRQLGHTVDDPVDLLRRNYDFYEQRTSHGSTLSKVVHSVVAGYIYPSHVAWDWFMEAMRSDIFDTQGGTTIEGIHTGVMAGTLEVIKQDFTGLDLSGNHVSIHPDLPPHWGNVVFRFCHRKIWYEVSIDQHSLCITAKGRGDQEITVLIDREKHTLKSGIQIEVPRNGDA